MPATCIAPRAVRATVPILITALLLLAGLARPAFAQQTPPAGLPETGQDAAPEVESDNPWGFPDTPERDEFEEDMFAREEADLEPGPFHRTRKPDEPVKVRIDPSTFTYDWAFAPDGLRRRGTPQDRLAWFPGSSTQVFTGAANSDSGTRFDSVTTDLQLATLLPVVDNFLTLQIGTGFGYTHFKPEDVEGNDFYHIDLSVVALFEVFDGFRIFGGVTTMSAWRRKTDFSDGFGPRFLGGVDVRVNEYLQIRVGALITEAVGGTGIEFRPILGLWLDLDQHFRVVLRDVDQWFLGFEGNQAAFHWMPLDDWTFFGEIGFVKRRWAGDIDVSFNDQAIPFGVGAIYALDWGIAVRLTLGFVAGRTITIELDDAVFDEQNYDLAPYIAAQISVTFG